MTRVIKGIGDTVKSRDFSNDTNKVKNQFTGIKPSKKDPYIIEMVEQQLAPICPKIRYFELLEEETKSRLALQFNIDELQAIKLALADVVIPDFSEPFYIKHLAKKIKSKTTMKKIKALSYPELFFLVRMAESGILFF